MNENDTAKMAQPSLENRVKKLEKKTKRHNIKKEDTKK